MIDEETTCGKKDGEGKVQYITFLEEEWPEFQRNVPVILWSI